MNATPDLFRPFFICINTTKIRHALMRVHTRYLYKIMISRKQSLVDNVFHSSISNFIIRRNRAPTTRKHKCAKRVHNVDIYYIATFPAFIQLFQRDTLVLIRSRTYTIILLSLNFLAIMMNFTYVTHRIMCQK